MKGGWWSAPGLRLRGRLLILTGIVMMLAALAAGLAGHGLAGFALMAAAFAVARLLARPWLLGKPADLSRDLAGQVALVLVLFWLGVGIGAATGWHPALPLWLPAPIALAAGGLARLIWRPMPPEMDGFLDEATETLTRMAADFSADTAGDTEQTRHTIADLCAALDALPQTGVSHYDLVDVLLEGMGRIPVPDFIDTLHGRATGGAERDLRALVIGLTDPWVAERALGQRELNASFEVIVTSGNAAALSAWAMGAGALLDAVPHAAIDMPPADRLLFVAQSQDAALRKLLAELAARLETFNRETEA
ncbi:hypothetical protein [Gemmobacter nectariphilus]|uniref:hypothetical protein n=1 Tax=Gemmobacter nectariphilus TaxID=220343 RepID=UPI0004220169|nr:hypothetical protein [Gemmobacter nectariphilus]